jgi:hypothetical protein
LNQGYSPALRRAFCEHIGVLQVTPIQDVIIKTHGAGGLWMDEQVKVHLKSPHPSPLPGGGEGVDVALPANLSILRQAEANHTVHVMRDGLA